uniref:RING-type domain-containing protein n=1 Tax=Psilocybe cubensis TaxID=181762 RepID=A0A8H7XQH5_PSICU
MEQPSIPDDLPAPITTRNRLPRSRTTSRAPSDASISRPGSRSSMRSARSIQGETQTQLEPASAPAPAFTSAQASGYSEYPYAYYSPIDVEMANYRSGPSQGSGSGSSYRSRYYDPIERSQLPVFRDSSYSANTTSSLDQRLPFTEFMQYEESGIAGSSMTRKRKRDDDDTFHPFMDAEEPQSSSWQTSEPLHPLRLGFEQTSGSGSGYGGSSGSGMSMAAFTTRGAGAGSSQPRPMGSSPSSEHIWKRETEEVAGFLLGTDADNSSQFGSFLSSGPSSQGNPPDKIDRKGKGKAKARTQTPDPSSIIDISDSPPLVKEKKVEAPSSNTTAAKGKNEVVDPLSSYTCPICFSPPVNATLTPCGHICCGSCLFAAVKTTMARATTTYPGVPEARCPVCRALIPRWDGKGGGVIGLRPRVIFRL